NRILHHSLTGVNADVEHVADLMRRHIQECLRQVAASYWVRGYFVSLDEANFPESLAWWNPTTSPPLSIPALLSELIRIRRFLNSHTFDRSRDLVLLHQLSDRTIAVLLTEQIDGKIQLGEALLFSGGGFIRAVFDPEC